MEQFELRCPYPVSLRHTVSSHGWVNLAPWHWDAETVELSRTERLETGRLAPVRVSQSNARSVVVKIDVDNLGRQEFEEIEAIVKRWLSIDWNPMDAVRVAEINDPRIALFIKNGGGRFLRGSTFYEDFVKTVCTINASWAFTVRMVSSLVTQIGNGVFPTPSMVVERGEKFLAQEVRLGFRARVLAESSQELQRLGIVDSKGNRSDTELVHEDLLGLRGIGPYSSNHVMMLCHDFSRVPIDSEVSAYCRERHGMESEEIEVFFDVWGDYRFLGYKLERILERTNWVG